MLRAAKLLQENTHYGNVSSAVECSVSETVLQKSFPFCKTLYGLWGHWKTHKKGFKHFYLSSNYEYALIRFCVTKCEQEASS